MVERGLTQIGKTEGYGVEKIIIALMGRCYVFRKLKCVAVFHVVQ
jgi:hypothetical protein